MSQGELMMDKKVIQEEIDVCNSILAKFKDEMADCKADYEKLKELEPMEAQNPNFKKAFIAVKERHDDIALSVKLIRNRLDKLAEDLKNAE